MITQNDLSKEAGIIDIVDDSTIYYCYPETGVTSESEARWSICRALKVGTAWSFKWADGSIKKQYKASDRTTLVYSWLK